MTQEDKAKRYDEAIKAAKSLCKITTSLPMKEYMESLFPELQEPDDDRIINNIKKAVESYWSYEPLYEILAWLKKQGEQKPAIKLERDDNGQAVLTPFEAELFSMMSEAWQGYSFGEEVNIAKIVKEHSKELLERANEQKPAWNEEDEYCLAGAIETELYMLDVVNGVKKFDVGNSSIKEECTRELDWLKSLKERVQPQPKQEWSEEDEEMYNEVLTDIIYAKNDLEVKECLGLSKRAMEAFNWFSKRYKSLRPQNTWKPSDEQMQALCSKLPLLTGSGNEVQRVLETLYCDLKKLRNE